MLTPIAAPSSGIAAQQSGRARDLAVLANFFLPAAPVLGIVRSGCTTAYRTKLSSNADDQALERKLPGVHDRMVAAAGAYCDAESPAVLRRRHDRIKADWASLGAADLARLARLFAQATAEAGAVRIEAEPGEMMSDAARRVGGPTPQQAARFDAAQIAFSKTPGGAQLLTRVSAYQRRIDAENASLQGEIAGVVKGGLAAAHRAANGFARQKGLAPPYPSG